jgi:hypothetical protein
MISVVLAIAVVLAGIFGLAFAVTSFFDGVFWEDKEVWMIPIVICLISFCWLWHGFNAPKEYNIKTYTITMINDNTQIADVDGQLLNINKKLGVIAKPNQLLEVKSITNRVRGWVYFVEDRPEYKLVERGEINEK